MEKKCEICGNSMKLNKDLNPFVWQCSYCGIIQLFDENKEKIIDGMSNILKVAEFLFSKII